MTPLWMFISLGMLFFNLCVYGMHSISLIELVRIFNSFIFLF